MDEVSYQSRCSKQDLTALKSYALNDVIVFAGTVGSGKSTQMRLLSSVLRKNGLRVKTTSLKTNHILARLLVTILIFVLSERKKKVYPIRALIEERPELFRSIFKIWLFLDLISIAFKFLATILLPRKIGYTVLAEEYIPAAICDYMYISRALSMREEIIRWEVSFLLRLLWVGGPTTVVFFDAQRDDLLSRWRTRGSPTETSEYLLTQRSVLLPLSKKLSAHEVLLVNTSDKEVTETHDFLVRYFLKACLKRRFQLLFNKTSALGSDN